MLRLTIIHCLIVFSLQSISIAQTSNETRETKRQQLLERFPKADLNNDGKLTEAEVKAYRKLRQATRPRQAAGNAPVKPTHKDVKYGPHERNVLDLYLAESDQATPLLIYIHGGGFVGGDKSRLNRAFVTQAKEAGISVASLNYRFATTDPFPASQHDAARAIQYLRLHAKEYNLDKKRFAAFGGSAGAGLSMWLAFHDDMATPESEDPVARESTRLVAVGSIAGQTTYDPNVIKKWIGGRAYQHPSIYKIYGIESLHEMTDPKLQPLYDEVSAIKHVTSDDPPIFLLYSEPDKPLPENSRPGQGIHHPIFAHKLREKLAPLGIESVYFHTKENKDKGEPFQLLLEFFQREFQAKK